MALRYLEVSTDLLNSWLIHGDSIPTAGTQAERNIGGRVGAISPTNQPVLEVLGWPGLGIEHIAVAGVQRTAWLNYLSQTGCRQLILAIGTNNYQMAPATWEAHLRRACNDALALGITPFIPTIPWSSDSARATGTAALDARTAAVIAAHPTLVKAGPDFRAYFQANPTLISGDTFHPSEPAGYNAYAQRVAVFIAAATPTSMPTSSGTLPGATT